jgi:catechol 2,3-dioxygenase-like lactoylglutathione lyase family enzyme
LLGRFHEITLPTPDIRSSIEFYEALGFTQAQTGDTWSHPYGVVSDGRLILGLHQGPRLACITYVRADVAALAAELEARGIELAVRRTGPDIFNEISFSDPTTGQLITVLEARTYSPPVRRPEEVSLCGYFAEFSLPASDFDAAQRFWEANGFVATPTTSEPYARMPLTSDYLDLAFHMPRTAREPLLVFIDEDMAARIERLQQQGFKGAAALPAGLKPRSDALLRAPEGTLLLLRTGDASA